MKICLIGDGAVGKTSLRERFLGRAFKANYMATIGADFALRRIEAGENEVKAQVWDLAGQQHFSKVRSLYYKGSDGLVIVFDVTRPSSFENVMNWLEEAQTHIGKEGGYGVILAGNKVDLRDNADPTHITPELGAKLCRSLAEKLSITEVPYVETSAKTNQNVELVFQRLVEIVIGSS